MERIRAASRNGDLRRRRPTFINANTSRAGPGESFFGVRREPRVVRRIDLDEIGREHAQRLEIVHTELPSFERRAIFREVSRVIASCVFAEPHVNSPRLLNRQSPLYPVRLG